PAGAAVASTGESRAVAELARDSAVTRGRIERYLGEVRFNEGRYEALLTGPIRGEGGQLLAVATVLLDVRPLAELLEDRSGLGESGEVQVATRRGGKIEFLLIPRNG